MEDLLKDILSSYENGQARQAYRQIKSYGECAFFTDLYANMNYADICTLEIYAEVTMKYFNMKQYLDHFGK